MKRSGLQQFQRIIKETFAPSGIKQAVGFIAQTVLLKVLPRKEPPPGDDAFGVLPAIDQIARFDRAVKEHLYLVKR